MESGTTRSRRAGDGEPDGAGGRAGPRAIGLPRALVAAVARPGRRGRCASRGSPADQDGGDDEAHLTGGAAGERGGDRQPSAVSSACRGWAVRSSRTGPRGPPGAASRAGPRRGPGRDRRVPAARRRRVRGLVRRPRCRLRCDAHAAQYRPGGRPGAIRRHGPARSGEPETGPPYEVAICQARIVPLTCTNVVRGAPDVLDWSPRKGYLTYDFHRRRNGCLPKSRGRGHRGHRDADRSRERTGSTSFFGSSPSRTS